MSVYPGKQLKPIFLFSLPRSGSTLGQRILASHEAITTASEPWLLLPLLYMLRDKGIYTDYRQATAMVAINDFCEALQDGRAGLDEEIRNFVLNLYSKTNTGGAKYFLDKTPRYHLIVDDIFKLFPGGKFIFLWRNPLSIVASLISSFSKGRWELYRFQVDLFNGVENLTAAAKRYKLESCAFRYEDLISNPKGIMQMIFSYLEVPFDPKVFSNFTSVELKGSKGDPTGIQAYSSLSSEPLDKWKTVLANPLRKIWSRRYLEWVGSERLALMGYDLSDLLHDLDNVPISFRYTISDLFMMMFGLAYRFFEPRIIKHKILKFPELYHIHAHT